MHRFHSLLLSCLLPLVALGAPADPPEDDWFDDPADSQALQQMLVLESGGHSGSVVDVLFTPDGKEIITSSLDKTVRFWSADTGELLRVWRVPAGSGRFGLVHGIALSPDGQRVAITAAAERDTGTNSALGRIYVVGRTTGRIIKTLDHALVPREAVFGQRNNLLYFRSLGAAAPHSWQMTSGEVTTFEKGHDGYARGLAFLPSTPSAAGKMASGGADHTVRIWSLRPGGLPHGEPLVIEAKDVAPTLALAFTPDGKHLLGAFLRIRNPEVRLRLWTVDGQLVQDYGRGTGPEQLPDAVQVGHVLFPYKDRPQVALLSWGAPDPDNPNARLRGVSFLNLTTGTLRTPYRFQTQASFIRPSAMSPDGRLVATIGGIDHEVAVWDTDTGRVRFRLGGTALSPRRAGWSKTGNTIFWDVGDPERLQGRRSCSFDFDQLQLAAVKNWDRPPLEPSVGDVSLRFTQVTRAEIVRKGAAPIPLSLGPRKFATALALSSDGRRGYLGTGLNALGFDVQTGKIDRTYRCLSGALAMAPSPDGKYVLIAGGDQILHIHRVQDQQALLHLFVSGGEWVAWTEDGLYAASPGGERLTGWHVNRGSDRLADFHPTSRFRASLYRPELIKTVLKAGAVPRAEAVRAAAAQKALVSVSFVRPTGVKLQGGPLRWQVDQKELKLEAVATVEGDQAVQTMQLLREERPYDGEQSVRTTRAVASKYPASWTVRLLPGPQRFRVLAKGQSSNALSDEVEITYVPPVAVPKPPKARLVVLPIGVNSYGNGLRPLRCAVNDATRLGDAFQSHASKVYDVEVRPLPEAKRADLLDGLDWLAKQRLGMYDTAVIFFAGHGARDAANRFFLLPKDADPNQLGHTAISGDELKGRLVNLSCRVVLMLDACHAGAIGGLADDLTKALSDDGVGVVVMCAAMGKEEAQEVALAGEKVGHGHFARAIIEGLAGKAPRSLKDGRVYLLHLQQYVFDRVQQLSGDEQHPTNSTPTSVRNFVLSEPPPEAPSRTAQATP